MSQAYDNELTQLMNEDKEDVFSDEQDLVSQIDIDDFEQRLQTSQLITREKPQNQQQRVQSSITKQNAPKHPQSLKELNEKMNQNLKQQQQIRQKQPLHQSLSQTQQIAPKPNEKKKQSVDNRNNAQTSTNQKQILDRAQKDNQELIQKVQQLKIIIKQLENENIDLKQELQKKNNQSGFLPRIDSAVNNELKQLKTENDELKKALQKQYGSDNGRMLQQYGLQVAKLKCKIEEMEQKYEKK